MKKSSRHAAKHLDSRLTPITWLRSRPPESPAGLVELAVEALGHVAGGDVDNVPGDQGDTWG